jgi:hypothetical protein
MESGMEVGNAPIVPGGDAAKMFEFIEEALDPVAQFAGDGVMGNVDLGRAERGDDGLALPISLEHSRIGWNR